MSSRFLRMGNLLINMDDTSVIIGKGKNIEIYKRGDYEGVGIIPINKTLDELLEILNDKEPSCDWIPISERLPKEKLNVLLALKHNMVVGFWEYVSEFGSNEWYVNTGDGFYTSIDKDVPVAWMPLPDLYEGEQNE